MKKIIAATAIAAGLFAPLAATAVAYAAPAPSAASTVQAATDTIQIRSAAEATQGRQLDIFGKAGPNHTGERVEVIRDGQRIASPYSPKITADGTITALVDAGTQGNHNYEVRLYNNNETLTAISNVISVYTR